MIFDADDPAVRELIDQHKQERMADPHRRRTYEYCVDNPELAFRFWVEQIGDAELYEAAYEEGTADE